MVPPCPVKKMSDIRTKKCPRARMKRPLGKTAPAKEVFGTGAGEGHQGGGGRDGFGYGVKKPVLPCLSFKELCGENKPLWYIGSFVSDTSNLKGVGTQLRPPLV